METMLEDVTRRWAVVTPTGCTNGETSEVSVNELQREWR